jgi:hypothetical protein
MAGYELRMASSKIMGYCGDGYVSSLSIVIEILLFRAPFEVNIDQLFAFKIPLK